MNRRTVKKKLEEAKHVNMVGTIELVLGLVLLALAYNNASLTSLSSIALLILGWSFTGHGMLKAVGGCAIQCLHEASLYEIQRRTASKC